MKKKSNPQIPWLKISSNACGIQLSELGLSKDITALFLFNSNGIEFGEKGRRLFLTYEGSYG